MSHGTRIYPDLFYQSPNVPVFTWWETIDATLAKCINGDAGGTWNPSAPIFITGFAGMIAGGPWSLASGATVVSTPATPITFGDSDYFQLSLSHSARSRSLVTTCGELIDMSDLSSSIYATGGSATTHVNTSLSVARLWLPLRVHNGASLASVTFTFVITTHGSVPVQLPQFRVFRKDASGNITPLNNTLVGGYQTLPTPGSGSAYHNGGATQTLTYVVIIGNVVDTSQYTYWAEIVDESGTNAVAGNVWLAATANFLGIQDMQPQ